MITKMSASSMNTKTWYRSMLAGNDAYSPGSYELISTAYGTGASATVTINSIPSGYKHLELRIAAADTDTTNRWLSNIDVRFNGDSSTNYSYHYLVGSGSSVITSAGSSSTSMNLKNVITGQQPVGAGGAVILSIADYANASTYKTLRYIGGTPAFSEQGITFGSGNWRSTSAITSITIIGGVTNFTTSSRFSLYGIKG